MAGVREQPGYMNIVVHVKGQEFWFLVRRAVVHHQKDRPGRIVSGGKKVIPALLSGGFIEYKSVINVLLLKIGTIQLRKTHCRSSKVT
jgi:hypothetical protein